MNITPKDAGTFDPGTQRTTYQGGVTTTDSGASIPGDADFEGAVNRGTTAMPEPLGGPLSSAIDTHVPKK